MTPTRSAGAAAPPRWGFGDFLLVWIAALVVAVIAQSIALSMLGVSNPKHIPRPDEITATIVTLYAQGLALAGGVALVGRWRGSGRSLRSEFGLVVRLRDTPWILVGVGISVASGLLIVPLTNLSDKKIEQHVVTIFRGASGTQLVLFAIAVGIVAPIAEELVFRGLLLRTLLRRVSAVPAVVIAAAVFSFAHLIDPSAYIALFPLMLLSIISGVVAVRSFELSKSIFLHIGFNLITVILIAGKFST